MDLKRQRHESFKTRIILYLYTGCTDFYGNKIKHYVSEMKADIKLCISSFSVVTLPVFSAWSRLSSRHVHTEMFNICGTVNRHNYVWGSEKILMMLLNMSMLHWMSVCGVLWWKTKLLVLSFLKNMCWQETLFGYDGECFCLVSLWEQFYSEMVYHFTSPIVLMPFRKRSFLIIR